eukprot:CAMPEP_0184689244 /NCGR_PEP_ID=MMETSP0312-20130426/30548_1 /TAXON_ID=31354 /ORGANISM="Compsopogon coeruleus, Strain SAG 36.94" /LENGTH=71 /DNA_ID=CAMNT_0027146573 /DNA_START=877 /DNA_END=1093 /DNA_ORIENTATION=+
MSGRNADGMNVAALQSKPWSEGLQSSYVPRHAGHQAQWSDRDSDTDTDAPGSDLGNVGIMREASGGLTVTE